MAKYCTHCGKQINENASFCKFCGAKVDFQDVTVERPVERIKKQDKGEKLPKGMVVVIVAAATIAIITAIVGAIMYFSEPRDTASPNEVDNTETANTENDSAEFDDTKSKDESNVASQIPEDAIEYNGHYYKLYNETMLWTEAERACEKMSGHLVTITSKDEQQKIVEMIETYSEAEKYNFWIGGSDSEQEGTFRWVTGEPIPLDMSTEGGYENWKSGQPNNNDTSAEGDQDYLQICCTDINDTDRYGKWYDMSDTGLSQTYEGPPYYKDPKYSGYICEWDSAN